MKSEQLVSVIVPVYKVEQYLEKCVNSLLAQTYQNLEIVLVDDGSPDNCPTMCDNYMSKHSNIKAYHKQNGGLGSARNYGVQRSAGTLIAFVDSDDYVEPQYIEDLLNLIQKNKADIAITRLLREYEGAPKPVNKNNLSDYNISKEKAIFTAYSGGKFGWTACGKLYKRELLLKYPFPVGLYEDAAIMYKILNECNVCAIGGDNKINYHYVTREGSILKRGLEQKHFHIFDICEEFSQFISCNYPDMSVLPILFYRRAVTQLLNLQKMDNTTYRKIFHRYIKMFRRNLLKVLMNKHISVKSKYYMTWLCTTPFIYKIQYFIIHKIKN